MLSCDKTRVQFSKGVNHNISSFIVHKACFKMFYDLGIPLLHGKKKKSHYCHIWRWKGHHKVKTFCWLIVNKGLMTKLWCCLLCL